MLRLCLIFFAMAVLGCVLDRGEDRRPEIRPGRYQASGNGSVLEYDFRTDGGFTFVRTDSGRVALTESGRWEYRYDGPSARFLIESDVTRRDLGSDGVWTERTGLDYSYRIVASTEEKFHLNPGTGDWPGLLALLFLIDGPNHVVFHRQ